MYALYFTEREQQQTRTLIDLKNGDTNTVSNEQLK